MFNFFKKIQNKMLMSNFFFLFKNILFSTLKVYYYLFSLMWFPLPLVYGGKYNPYFGWNMVSNSTAVSLTRKIALKVIQLINFTVIYFILFLITCRKRKKRSTNDGLSDYRSLKNIKIEKMRVYFQTLTNFQAKNRPNITPRLIWVIFKKSNNDSLNGTSSP